MCFPLSPSSPSKFAFQQIPYLLPFKIHKVLCAAGRQGPAASGAEEIGSNEAKGGWWATDGGRHLTQSMHLRELVKYLVHKGPQRVIPPPSPIFIGQKQQ